MVMGGYFSGVNLRWRWPVCEGLYLAVRTNRQQFVAWQLIISCDSKVRRGPMMFCFRCERVWSRNVYFILIIYKHGKHCLYSGHGKIASDGANDSVTGSPLPGNCFITPNSMSLSLLKVWSADIVDNHDNTKTYVCLRGWGERGCFTFWPCYFQGNLARCK